MKDSCIASMQFLITFATLSEKTSVLAILFNQFLFHHHDVLLLVSLVISSFCLVGEYLIPMT